MSGQERRVHCTLFTVKDSGENVLTDDWKTIPMLTMFEVSRFCQEPGPVTIPFKVPPISTLT